MEAKNYVSLAQYAKLCKAERQTIYDRIKAGKIEAETIKGINGIVIDLNRFPPKKAKRTGRPTIEEQLKKLNP